ncbi:cysteine synthase B [Monoraphidium neglectum]|uniref:Cysteine synthase B n=1 Tax=Monoraphidium neglectum TaxID=145388 RepID=A0A0D2LGN3_9CHLO|nr:cysteine synthase B [Monoraphidium neglectum]KIZ05644.1 cysteine synthase B [Monoraphidium neglectum]|eukprot:XP_013904663.1 cysteine synthase B [Monoraphidium neglectum]
MRVQQRAAQAAPAAVRQRARTPAPPTLTPAPAPATAPTAPRVALPRPGLRDAFPTVEELVGHTPIVRLQHLPGNTTNIVLAKLEGHNPAGSAKDRPALHMLKEAERRGQIRRGDTIIEATSGNTGIALAMAAAIRGYKLKLILPSSSSAERIATMTAYGAEVILAPSMEASRDMLVQMEREGLGHCLDQYNNEDNTASHYIGTGPEIWAQTGGRVTHVVSSMGTFGTIMGTGRYLKERNPAVQVVGLQPSEHVSIPGIRRWSPGYVPSLYKPEGIDRVLDLTAREAEETARCLARVEGIFAGISGAGAVSAALRLSAEVDDAVIVAVVCDRGDRYLSTGVFNAAAGAEDPAPCHAAEFHSALARLLHGHAGPHYVLFTAGAGCEGGEGEAAAAAALKGAALLVRKFVRDTWDDPAAPSADWQEPGHGAFVDEWVSEGLGV